MKRPEHVTAAVTACHQALRGQAPALDVLEEVFSRSGFTSEYFDSHRTLDMFGHRCREDVVATIGVLPALSSVTQLPIAEAMYLRFDAGIGIIHNFKYGTSLVEG